MWKVKARNKKPEARNKKPELKNLPSPSYCSVLLSIDKLKKINHPQ